jgi:hypothetical protein
MGVILNCNLLNVFYEGQYAQAFVSPFAVLFAILYLNILYCDPKHYKSIVGESFLLTSGLFAIILPSYAEFFIALLAVFSLGFLFYARFNRETFFCLAKHFITLIVFAALININFVIHWIPSLIDNWLENLMQAGFSQPHWAVPSEILGFSDMYKTVGYSLIKRSFANLIFNLFLSLFVLVLMIRLFFKESVKGKFFYCAIFILFLFIFLFHSTNYQYYKLYTFFIPFLSLIFYYALLNFPKIQNYDKSFFVLVKLFSRTSIFYVCVFVQILVGLNYIYQYRKESDYISRDMRELALQNIQLGDYVIYTNQKSISEYMLTPLLSFNWINESGFKHTEPYLDKTVLVLVNKKSSKTSDYINKFDPLSVMFENDSYILINSHSKLRDINLLTLTSSYNEWPSFLR